MDERARASKIILFQSVVGPILAQVIALAYVIGLPYAIGNHTN